MMNAWRASFSYWHDQFGLAHSLLKIQLQGAFVLFFFYINLPSVRKKVHFRKKMHNKMYVFTTEGTLIAKKVYKANPP